MRTSKSRTAFLKFIDYRYKYRIYHTSTTIETFLVLKLMIILYLSSGWDLKFLPTNFEPQILWIKHFRSSKFWYTHIIYITYIIFTQLCLNSSSLKKQSLQQTWQSNNKISIVVVNARYQCLQCLCSLSVHTSTTGQAP